MTKATAHGNIILAFGTRDAFAHGEMAEWSKAPVLKTGDVKASVGSNPTLSARKSYMRKYPSGRRGSPAKGVGRQKRREGSNPSFRAKKDTMCIVSFFFCAGGCLISGGCGVYIVKAQSGSGRHRDGGSRERAAIIP